jgi:hypothetical protein
MSVDFLIGLTRHFESKRFRAQVTAKATLKSVLVEAFRTDLTSENPLDSICKSYVDIRVWISYLEDGLSLREKVPHFFSLSYTPSQRWMKSIWIHKRICTEILAGEDSIAGYRPQR